MNATFDAFDGRSVRIKSNAELADGLNRVSGFLKQCDDAPGHRKMWSGILRDIVSEIAYREKRDEKS